MAIVFVDYKRKHSPKKRDFGTMPVADIIADISKLGVNFESGSKLQS